MTSETTTPVARAATRDDAAAIARIYNQGIEDRIATFETDARTTADIERLLPLLYPETQPAALQSFPLSAGEAVKSK